ncbi:hypothetical protein DL768_007379 [Monosporascus sp. mg162]|nr:hypothetical protein DL768_007379 [Monosporascus sp. mg162]
MGPPSRFTDVPPSTNNSAIFRMSSSIAKMRLLGSQLSQPLGEDILDCGLWSSSGPFESSGCCRVAADHIIESFEEILAVYKPSVLFCVIAVRVAASHNMPHLTIRDSFFIAGEFPATRYNPPARFYKEKRESRFVQISQQHLRERAEPTCGVADDTEGLDVLLRNAEDRDVHSVPPACRRRLDADIPHMGSETFSIQALARLLPRSVLAEMVEREGEVDKRSDGVLRQYRLDEHFSVFDAVDHGVVVFAELAFPTRMP